MMVARLGGGIRMRQSLAGDAARREIAENGVIPQTITALSPPALGALADGDTLSGAVTWGTYETSAGDLVAPTTREMRVSGGAFVPYDGATVVAAGDTYVLRETVETTEGDSRSFATATVIVAGTAPTVTASDSLVGRVLTISLDTLSGAPAPVAALSALTLDGADVLGDATGTGPWQYDVPSSAAAQDVAWTVTATNAEGSDTAQGAEAVPADLFAPTAASAPAISGTVQPGETVTITEGTYTGTAPITITGALTLDGADVTGDMVGADYTIPAGTVGQDLVWSETASNGVAPDATQSATETVVAVPPPLDLASLFETGTYPGSLHEPDDLSSVYTDAAGTINATGVDDACRYLADTSGNGHHFVRAAIDEAPRVKLNGAGKYVIETDGLDDMMTTIDTVDFSAVSTITVALGVRPLGTSGKHGLFGTSDNIGDGRILIQSPFDALNWRMFVGAGGTSAGTSDAAYPPGTRVLMIRATLTGALMWLDDVSDGAEVASMSYTLSAWGNRTMTLGALVGGIQFANAQYTKAMAIGRDLTEAQRLDVAARIANDMGHTI